MPTQSKLPPHHDVTAPPHSPAPPAPATPVNPLAEELTGTRHARPCALVIFGATGDLTKRKLVPSLMGLAKDGLLPHGFTVVGFARRPWTDDTFQKELAEGVRQHGRDGTEAAFAARRDAFVFHQADFEWDPLESTCRHASLSIL